MTLGLSPRLQQADFAYLLNSKMLSLILLVPAPDTSLMIPIAFVEGLSRNGAVSGVSRDRREECEHFQPLLVLVEKEKSNLDLTPGSSPDLIGMSDML